MSFTMSPEHLRWSEGVLKNVRKWKGIPDFGEEMGTITNPSDPNMSETGNQGTFSNFPGNSPSLLASQSTYDNANSTTGNVINAAKNVASDPTAQGVLGGAIAGSVFGPVGTLLGGALGGIAEKAYQDYSNGGAGEIVHSGYPIDPSVAPTTNTANPPPPVTPEQAAHAAGAALANGHAKQNLGTMPKPNPNLTPEQQAAQTIVHGLSGKGGGNTAPDPTKQGVIGILPSTVQPGLNAGIMDLGGGSWPWIIGSAVVIGGFALYEKYQEKHGKGASHPRAHGSHGEHHYKR